MKTCRCSHDIEYHHSSHKCETHRRWINIKFIPLDTKNITIISSRPMRKNRTTTWATTYIYICMYILRYSDARFDFAIVKLDIHHHRHHSWMSCHMSHHDCPVFVLPSSSSSSSLYELQIPLRWRFPSSHALQIRPTHPPIENVCAWMFMSSFRLKKRDVSWRWRRRQPLVHHVRLCKIWFASCAPIAYTCFLYQIRERAMLWGVIFHVTVSSGFKTLPSCLHAIYVVSPVTYMLVLFLFIVVTFFFFSSAGDTAGVVDCIIILSYCRAAFSSRKRSNLLR